MKVTYAHNTTPDVVRERLDDAARKALNVGQGRVEKAEYAWTGNTLDFSVTAMGATIKGNIVVTDTDIVLDAHIPLFLRAFEGKAKSRILDRFREMFG